jgi:hypothetical protein
MMINKESLLKKYESPVSDNRNSDKLDEKIKDLIIYVERYDTELYDTALNNMLDNLTKEQFDKLLTAVNRKLLDGYEDKYRVSAIYDTVSVTKTISLKQLKCFAAFLKLIKHTENKVKKF